MNDLQSAQAIALIAAQGLSYYLEDGEGIVCRIDDPTADGESTKYVAYKDGELMRFQVCDEDLEAGRKVWVHQQFEPQDE